jgi:8-oxo-dGTP pyrophosphatase MutT (NUDIX family)
LIEPVGWPVPQWLADHAREFYATGGIPAAPRVAATVVLLRPAPGGFQVYVIRRAATMAFASGMYAFPGGSVDPRDGSAGQAVLCAAAREVFEEAGILLAGPDESTVVGDVSGDDWEAQRRALVERTLSMADLLRARQLVLRADLLVPWARWITPEFEPRRYDTYFFLSRLPEGQYTRDVSGEADHTVWISPADALARQASGEIAMLPPTLVMLTELAAYSDVDSAVAAAGERDTVTAVMPRLDGDRLVVP